MAQDCAVCNLLANLPFDTLYHPPRWSFHHVLLPPMSTTMSTHYMPSYVVDDKRSPRIGSLSPLIVPSETTFKPMRTLTQDCSNLSCTTLKLQHLPRNSVSSSNRKTIPCSNIFACICNNLCERLYHPSRTFPSARGLIMRCSTVYRALLVLVILESS